MKSTSTVYQRPTTTRRTEDLSRHYSTLPAIKRTTALYCTVLYCTAEEGVSSTTSGRASDLLGSFFSNIYWTFQNRHLPWTWSYARPVTWPWPWLPPWFGPCAPPEGYRWRTMSSGEWEPRDLHAVFVPQPSQEPREAKRTARATRYEQGRSNAND